jgi:hypothetical protein
VSIAEVDLPLEEPLQDLLVEGNPPLETANAEPRLLMARTAR